MERVLVQLCLHILVQAIVAVTCLFYNTPILCLTDISGKLGIA